MRTQWTWRNWFCCVFFNSCLYECGWVLVRVGQDIMYQSSLRHLNEITRCEICPTFKHVKLLRNGWRDLVLAELVTAGAWFFHRNRLMLHILLYVYCQSKHLDIVFDMFLCPAFSLSLSLLLQCSLPFFLWFHFHQLDTMFICWLQYFFEPDKQTYKHQRAPLSSQSVTHSPNKPSKL